MSTATALRRLMDEALAAFADGDAAEAERRAKAVTALARAEKEVAELEAAQAGAQGDDEESRRAELRRRIARFVDAANAGADDAQLDDIATGRHAE